MHNIMLKYQSSGSDHKVIKFRKKKKVTLRTEFKRHSCTYYFQKNSEHFLTWGSTWIEVRLMNEIFWGLRWPLHQEVYIYPSANSEKRVNCVSSFNPRFIYLVEFSFINVCVESEAWEVGVVSLRGFLPFFHARLVNHGCMLYKDYWFRIRWIAYMQCSTY